MNADRIQKLERSDKFKQKIYSKGIWKNYAIVPPSVVVFVALFGFLYLFNLDRLVSYYTIPFVLFMLFGTYWLKYTRKYLVSKKVANSEDLKICLSIPLLKKNGKTIWVFSVGKNRHNKYYIEKEKSLILDKIESGKFDESLFSSKMNLEAIPETDIYIVIPAFSDRISNKNSMLTVNKYIVFENSAMIKSMTNGELESFD